MFLLSLSFLYIIFLYPLHTWGKEEGEAEGPGTWKNSLLRNAIGMKVDLCISQLLTEGGGGSWTQETGLGSLGCSAPAAQSQSKWGGMYTTHRNQGNHSPQDDHRLSVNRGPLPGVVRPIYACFAGWVSLTNEKNFSKIYTNRFTMY
jgi:hypothetical protein